MMEITSQTYCPTDDELMQYKLGNSAKDRFQKITEHLVTCNVCTRTILDFLPETEEEWQALKTSGDENSEDGASFTQNFVPPDLVDDFERLRQDAMRLEKKRQGFEKIGLEGLRIGQVWRPKSDNIIVPTFEGKEYVSEFKLNSRNHFVVISDAQPQQMGHYLIVKVIPVDDHTSLTAGDEIVVSAKFNPLERDLILQVWNEKEMLVENLESCFGKLSDAWVETEREKHHITFSNGSFGIKELFIEFKKNLSDFAYEPLNIIRQGLIADPVYRYRAKEVAETNYLNYPVESLRYTEAQKKSSAKVATFASFRAFLEEIKAIIPMSPMPDFAWAADSIQSGWKEISETYFDGRLKRKIRKSVEGDNLIHLQSKDAEFANRFVLLGEVESDLTLAFLTSNNPIHQSYVSVLNFGKNEIPNGFYSDRILDAGDLAKLDPQLIQNSIARVDEINELSAWKKLADTPEIDAHLSQIIHHAVRVRED